LLEHVAHVDELGDAGATVLDLGLVEHGTGSHAHARWSPRDREWLHGFHEIE
jgi:hypothetical protein